MNLKNVICRSEIKTVRCFIGSLLNNYQIRFNDDLLDDLVSEMYESVIRRNYWNKFANNRTTFLYLECRSVISRWLRRKKAEKRSPTSESCREIKEIYARGTRVSPEVRIDLKRFIERLDEDLKLMVNLYAIGYSYSEIGGITGMQTNVIEYSFRKLRAQNADYWN